MLVKALLQMGFVCIKKILQLMFLHAVEVIKLWLVELIRRMNR